MEYEHLWWHIDMRLLTKFMGYSQTYGLTNALRIAKGALITNPSLEVRIYSAGSKKTIIIKDVKDIDKYLILV